MKGNQVVGLYPAFVKDRTVGTTVLAAARAVDPRLGPLLMPASPKRRKRERVNSTFTRAAARRAGESRSRSRCSGPPVRYRSPTPPVRVVRPSLGTSFTYMLGIPDQDPSDDLLGSFSKSLRREIRDARGLDVTVTKSPTEGVDEVFESVQSRYAEQDRGFTLTKEYVDDLTTALAAEGSLSNVRRSRPRRRVPLGDRRPLPTTPPTGSAGRANVRRHERQRTGALERHPGHRRRRSDSLGRGVRPDGGANTERICRYKKVSSAPSSCRTTLESEGRRMNAAKAAYRLASR